MQIKKPPCGGSFVWLLNNVCQSENALFKYHKDKVQKPYNVKTKYDTDKESDDFAFLKSGYRAEYPRCNGDNSEDNTEKVSQTEVVSSACHFFLLFKIFYNILILSFWCKKGNKISFSLQNSLVVFF